jgi:hypothetical protein
MEPFLQQLTDLIQDEPTLAKWAIVPSLAVGHNVGERLASEGIAWGNLRFTTVFDLAVRVAGPGLAREGKALVDQAVGPALTLELLLDLPATPPYFRAIAEQSGVAESLWTTVSELRLAGIGAGALKPERFASAAKAEELGALLQAYELYLHEHCLADAADCLRTAATAKNKFPITADSLLLEMPGSCDSPLERAFLDSLPARRTPAHIAAIPGLELPAGFARLNCKVQPVEPMDASFDAARLAWIARPAEAPSPVRDGSLSLFRAAGCEAEVEEVFRRIQAGPFPLGSVEVVCAQPAEYASLFWEKAVRHGWPVTIDRGVPGALTRPVRAAFGLCDWIENNFPAVRLARMLEAGILEPGSGAELTGSAAARILRQCGATLGRKSYATTLAAFAASCEERASDLETDEDIRVSYGQRAARARQLGEWLTSVLDKVPEPSGGTVVLGKHRVPAIHLVRDAILCLILFSDTEVREHAEALPHAGMGPAGPKPCCRFSNLLLASRAPQISTGRRRPAAGECRLLGWAVPTRSHAELAASRRPTARDSRPSRKLGRRLRHIDNPHRERPQQLGSRPR